VTTPPPLRIDWGHVTTEELHRLLVPANLRTRRATKGELAELRHMVHDADADSVTTPIPYPAPTEESTTS
jgi:hypothetical protein